MTTSAHEKVGVVGCGLMGAGIAETCARAGQSVIVVETDATAVDAGRRRLETSLDKAESRGKIDSAAEVLDRIEVVEGIEALSDRSIVIEAIMEDEGVKTRLFGDLDRVVADPAAILASNTSSIPIIKLATATKRPEYVMGIHFFNPVPVLTLVELVPSFLTAGATTERARTFVQDVLGKHAIDCKDRAGFVVNALLIPFLLSAIRMVEADVATAADIDEGFVRGCAHPQGPLALSDLIGLDTVRAIADSLYDEYKDPHYACPPLLARMVEAGLLGRKSGRGFFTYS
ncbi:3-hydroxybutyryl-CoA dehydrogenase [Mycobacterium sp. 21AC1]|uniref:3-hydroxybutyryl-CoA dehydrogenase n=1 Tax=[Mycobacterium] appelbergii TaxID=2939269 RepID=UPI00293909C7|nr:3-hydroxybutyryl-CoA dehydrogenase [Mycobacterium sp. 21AC1]MDV3125334.1 3-hydroxybutyryl-CoA dehydrogenase [Mycobacterium sp. 21AC1]